MASQHTNPPLNVRPDAALKADAKKKLEDRNRDLTAFVVACLTAVTKDPDGFLEILAPHWPPPKAQGRPRKNPARPSA